MITSLADGRGSNEEHLDEESGYTIGCMKRLVMYTFWVHGRRIDIDIDHRWLFWSSEGPIDEWEIYFAYDVNCKSSTQSWVSEAVWEVEFGTRLHVVTSPRRL